MLVDLWPHALVDRQALAAGIAEDQTRTLRNLEPRLDFRPALRSESATHLLEAGHAIDQDRLLRLEVTCEENSRPAIGDANGGHPHVAVSNAPPQHAPERDCVEANR
jgi:hypothetical protein